MVLTRSGAGFDVQGVERPPRAPAADPGAARVPLPAVGDPQWRDTASGEVGPTGDENLFLGPPSTHSEEEASILRDLKDDYERFKSRLLLNSDIVEVQTQSPHMFAGISSVPLAAAPGYARGHAHPPSTGAIPRHGSAGRSAVDPEADMEARNNATRTSMVSPFIASHSRTPGHAQSYAHPSNNTYSLALNSIYYSAGSSPPPVPPRIKIDALPLTAPLQATAGNNCYVNNNNVFKFLGPPTRTWHEDGQIRRQCQAPGACERLERQPYSYECDSQRPRPPLPPRRTLCEGDQRRSCQAPETLKRRESQPPHPHEVPLYVNEYYIPTMPSKRADVPPPLPPRGFCYEACPPIPPSYSQGGHRYVDHTEPPHRREEWRPRYDNREGKLNTRQFAPPPVPPRGCSAVPPPTPPPSYKTERVSGAAAAITDLAQAIVKATQVSHTHNRYISELPTFSGAAADWLSFRAAYNETAPFLSEAENTARLKKALKGPAKEAVGALFIGVAQPGDVMRRLEARFGRPDALVLAELDKVRALPKMTDDPRDVCVFACKISNIVAAVRALNKEHHLHSPEIAKTIEEKMTPIIRSRWFDFELSLPESEPALGKLGLFLEREAERNGRHARAEVVEERRDVRVPPPPARKGRVNTAGTSTSQTPRVVSTPASGAPPSAAAPIKCRVCEGAHLITDCAKFKSATVDDRWGLARELKLCFRCLRYRSWRHRCGQKCTQCTSTHHTLLHQNSAEKNTVSSTWSARPAAAFLKVVPVIVSGPKGECETYALLDDGSTVTLVEDSTARAVGAEGPLKPFVIEVVAGNNIRADSSRHVTLQIKGKYMGLPMDMSARTIDQLNLSGQTVTSDVLDDCEHLYDIRHELEYSIATPTILIGQDNWPLLLSRRAKVGPRDQPVASLTELGWVLHGRKEGVSIKQSCNMLQRVYGVNSTLSMEKQIEEHFALESMGIQPRRPRSDPEQRAVQLLERTIKELPEGGYEVGLPWRYEEPRMPDNYQAALGRLRGVERRLARDDTLRARYFEQIDRLVSEGYAERAPMPPPGGSTWYLPHFGVDNPAKKKLRIVHDAAAKTKGTSLNDLLLTGPDLLESLPGVLMRFRQHSVAVTADIKDMFLRIKVRPADRDALRFLWREQSDADTPTEFRMTSVIFGATSSPFTAIFVKNYNAERHGADHPAAVRSIIQCHYMDDYLESFRTVEEAKSVAGAVNEIHKKGKFLLQRWTSNVSEAITDVAGTPLETVTSHNLLNQTEKILGIIWQPASDYLSYNLNFTKVEKSVLDGSHVPTKRQLLSAAMSLYDPLGLVAPITIQPKHILQKTWPAKIEWDDPIPEPLYNDWKQWLAQLQDIKQLTIPRIYNGYSDADQLELHTFADASENTYATAVYWRAVGADGGVGVSLAAAKARVAGKISSVPRLELQAAVLGARLARTVREEHDRKPTREFYWTDSATVIAWLRAGARAFKPFVAHRVAELEELTNLEDWRWLPSADNVADDATRGLPQNFNSTHRWFVGPSFLYEDVHGWTHDPPSHSICTGEEKNNCVAEQSKLSATEITPDPARFSDWIRLLRATARVLQFIHLCRNRQTITAIKRTRANEQSDPTWTGNTRREKQKSCRRPVPKEIEKRLLLPAHLVMEAQMLLWKRSQALTFTAELSCITGGRSIPKESRLYNLPIFVDEDGLIKVKTRLRVAAALTPAQTTPIVLDGTDYVVRLYLLHVHEQLHHGGTEITVNEVRQRYHVLRLRPMVKQVISECQQCRIRRAKPTEPPTGELPLARLAYNQRPFTYVGLDYFGPIVITVGRSHQKRYVALFTCLTTRALHLEIAGSLTTDSAINAVRRMIGRRGCPTEMWSDNGTNLRGADTELRRAAFQAAEEEASIRAIKWRFIPPGAPFMGGAWERMVRSVKTALRATLHERYPTEDTLHTLLVEAEHTINSRPLTHVAVETDDEPALTPMHFILGGPSKVPLPGTFIEGDLLRRAHWRAAQQLANMFWRRWVREALPLLRLPRDPHGRGHPVREGDVVIIADGNLPRNSWPKGVVTKVFPGADGIVRTVDVRCSSGVLRRPAKKIIVLPVDPPRTTEN